MERSAIRENLRTHRNRRLLAVRSRIALRSIRATAAGTAGEFQMTGLVPIPTLKIWNQDIDASQYRTRCSREYVLRSIRRSTRAASIGVWYRAGPPFEAAPFRVAQADPIISDRSKNRSAEVAARSIGMSVAPLLHQRLEFSIVPVRQHDAGGDEQVAAGAG
jgi:hypothetical protein